MMQEGIEQDLSGKFHVIFLCAFGKKGVKTLPFIEYSNPLVCVSHLTQHTCLLLKFLGFSDILKFGEAQIHLLAIQLIL
jgi:hypothetical protein